ncbi:hypothetical protein FOPG_02958 [Fusarium oxysporum f. sp. conglutinans race 2 54008]|uniref:Conidiation-specific protein 6 n=1 Tax=Fusarium oxysporum f. sp. conglutinans race 2 54008 TaxID=1089457 RepID=X0IM34_FUSOX|nr:hypothetical protein FOPG_02958 [Fusarium oxysporum f. sp. conglutinans race 2 54008]
MLRLPAATRLLSTTPTPPRRPRSTDVRFSRTSSTVVRDNKDKNPGNVAGGLKATLNNPNVSDEAKKNAKERLDKEDF